MAHKHEHKAIPSPFKAVNQYEKAFVNAYNKNLAGAVADVLKYLAKATTAAIKDLKEDETYKTNVDTSGY